MLYNADSMTEQDELQALLTEAVLEEDEAEALRLLAAGADINADSGYSTPLAEAVEAHQAEAVRLCLRLGADMNRELGADAPYERLTPALMAVEEGESMLRLFLEAGLPVNSCNSYGQTLLMQAACYPKDAVLRLLLARGADTDLRNHDGKTALMLALEHGHTAAAALLRQSGAAE